jgi:hypothetical protein
VTSDRLHIPQAAMSWQAPLKGRRETTAVSNHHEQGDSNDVRPEQEAGLQRGQRHRGISAARSPYRRLYYTWFGKTIDDIDREHAERMQATTSAFDAVKSDPRHPSHAQARAAFEAVRGTTPDYKAAHNELDRAVRAAEADFRAELARIGGLYGDTVG